MNQAQSQGHSTPLKCLGSQWYILFEVEDKLLHLAHSTTKKEQHLVGIFEFWKKQIPHSSMVLLQPVY